jgi:hypothetical protein
VRTQGKEAVYFLYDYNRLIVYYQYTKSNYTVTNFHQEFSGETVS